MSGADRQPPHLSEPAYCRGRNGAQAPGAGTILPVRPIVVAGDNRFLAAVVRNVQTTERDLGCKQKLRIAVNDRLGIEPDAA